MSSTLLSPALQIIVDKLRDLINTGNVSKATVEGGWRYYGETFQKEINQLREAITKSGNNVVECHAAHFTRGANIWNPTNRLILIQIHGSSKIEPDESLRPGSYKYLEEERQALICESEEEVDVGIVALAKGTTFHKI
ncbi:hypothetical protein BDW59DRAFT_36288 [Aspergillus cavernicola]|uniref:Uncharacterized protein n=1 Tax=Aspergillus cavernicola TaxID=176166 RepID=A0ABR4IP93_9EURO